MEIQICPHCHQRVMLSRDGTCPGCRVRVVETGSGSLLEKGTGTTTNSGLMHGQVQPVVEPVPFFSSHFGSVETAFSDNDPSFRDKRLPATDSMNPYQSPSYFIDERAVEDASPGWRGTPWLLFSFEGRIPRRVFWGASIITTIVYYAAAIPLAVIVGDDSFENFSLASLPLYLLMLLMIWISLAISVKRWHDRDKWGWWVLIVIVPFIGPLRQFVETGCLRGTIGSNQYGLDPT